MIKVLLADDQGLFREGIKLILERDPEIEVAGSVENGFQALESCSRVAPDMILMDIKMPLCDGVEATKLIKEQYGQIKIIILSTFDDDANISKALEHGADGYVLKDINPDELIMAVKGTMRGLRIIHQNVYDQVRKQLTSSIKLSSGENDGKLLGGREIEIIRQIVLGKTNKEIGAELHLSEGRIKSLITEMLEKLQVKDRTQLAIYGIKNHLI